MRASVIKTLSVLFFLACIFHVQQALAWGFYSHRLINRMAVYTLPAEMSPFFKKHINYLAEHAVDPDKRSRTVPGEAEKHYIDMEAFREDSVNKVPMYWKDAVAKYTEDSLRAIGINPWWIEKMAWKLTQAFRDENKNLILYYAANMGHYIADATVPLHTSLYYDGKIPAQKGIHAFWETRIPELFASNYDFLVGKAEYIGNIQEKAWELIRITHAQLDTVFMVEEYMRANFPQDRMYAFESRGYQTMKQFSTEYSAEFSKRMNNMVERNLRRAIVAVGSFWYTCWVNAGQPDLSGLDNRKLARALRKEMKKTERMWKRGKPIGRPNPEEVVE
jgi:hypothetical protein